MIWAIPPTDIVEQVSSNKKNTALVWKAIISTIRLQDILLIDDIENLKLVKLIGIC